MKYELSKIEREIRPENIWNAFNGSLNRKASKANLSEIEEVFNVPLTQLILYHNILVRYNELFIDEECRITQSLKDYQINSTGVNNKYIVVNYEGLIKLYNKKDSVVPQKYIDVNLRLVDDIKKTIFKQIRYDLQIKFVYPLKNIFETNYKNILIDVGYIDSTEKAFLVAIKSSDISITALDANEPLNFQHIYSEKLNCNFQLNYNSCNSPYDYQKHLEKLYVKFKETIQSRFSVSHHKISDLEKLSDIKTIISETIDRFQTIDNKTSYIIQEPLYYKTDTVVNLKQTLFSLSLQNQNNEFQSIFQSYLSIQYQFLKDALTFIENKIELIKYSIEMKNSNSSTENTDTSLTADNKINTKLSVAQLAYLYKCLNNEKGILKERNKAALYRKISRNYRSSRQDKISPDSIRNKFSSPEANAIDFWIEKFTHLMQLAKNDAEIYGA
jgi:hypothetical protein